MKRAVATVTTLPLFVRSRNDDLVHLPHWGIQTIRTICLGHKKITDVTSNKYDL